MFPCIPPVNGCSRPGASCHVMWWMINYDLTIHLNQEKWIKDKHVEKETAFFGLEWLKRVKVVKFDVGFYLAERSRWRDGAVMRPSVEARSSQGGASLLWFCIGRQGQGASERTLSPIHDTSMQSGRNPIQIFTHTRGQRRILETQIMLDEVKPERTDWEDSEKKDGELERKAGERPLRRQMDVGREDMRTHGVRVGDGWFAEGKGKAEEADLFPQVLQLSTNDQTVKASQQDAWLEPLKTRQETTGGKLGTWTRNTPLGTTLQLENVTPLKHCSEVLRERRAFTLLCVGGRAGVGINIQDPPGGIQPSVKLKPVSLQWKEAPHRGQSRGKQTKEGEGWRAEKFVASSLKYSKNKSQSKVWI